MAKKYIEADEFWNRLISRSENNWVGFDTIDEVLSGMPSEPRWIPVTERLPEFGDRTLVTVPSIGETFVTIGTYAGEYTWHISDYGFCEKVTAWMPLPEPYMEGEQNG